MASEEAVKRVLARFYIANSNYNVRKAITAQDEGTVWGSPEPHCSLFEGPIVGSGVRANMRRVSRFAGFVRVCAGGFRGTRVPGAGNYRGVAEALARFRGGFSEMKRRETAVRG